MNYKKTITSIILIVGSVLVTNAQTEGVSIKSTVGPPDASAMLDVQSLNKGVLIPRVNLMSLSDNSTVPNPALSLLVYCLGTATGGLPAGYYYNSSATTTPAWIKISGSGDDLWTLATNKTDIYRNTGVVMIGITDLSIYTNTWGAKLWIDEGTLTLAGTNVYTGTNAIVYGSMGPHPFYTGLRANGTKSNPAPCKNGDVLCAFIGRSYVGQVSYNAGGSNIYMRATEDETPSGHGSNISFLTTANGSSPSIERMVIDQSGDIFIGNSSGTGSNPANRLQFRRRNGDLAFSCGYMDDAEFRLYNPTGDNVLSYWGGNDNVAYEDMHIDYAGNLVMKGSVTANGSVLNSDSTLKTNIVNLKGSSLLKIKQLRPVTYCFKSDTAHLVETGFIAQDVQKVIPELVTNVKTLRTSNSKVYSYNLGLNYIGIIPHLVKAIQEQEVLIEQLQQQNALIQQQNTLIQQQNTSLSNRIQALENK